MTLIPSLATVKIEDFKKKMKTWPSDKFIVSESFIVGSATGVVPISLKIIQMVMRQRTREMSQYM